MTAATACSEQEELMLRLQSQFGDMDLTNLLGQAHHQDDDARSEESSLAEPTPEELKAWQQAQFQKGQAQLEAKKDATKTALEKRRAEATEAPDHDWEQVPAAPNLQGQASVFFPTTDRGGAEIIGVHPLLQQLACKGDDLLGTTWQRLFASAHGDGLSLPNVLRKLEGYPGPTVLLIGAIPSASKSLTKQSTTAASATATRTTTIGFFTTTGWSVEDSPDCFLFAFDDDHNEDIQFFRPSRPDKKNQVYMHCQSSPAALWIGGSSSNQPRLHLTETLEECRALEFCSVFEAGDLLRGQAQDSLNYFDVTHIEVWAVGGEEWIAESLKTQTNHKAIGEANRLKAQRVDKHQLLQDFQGGLLSANGKPGGLFAHYGCNTERCDL